MPFKRGDSLRTITEGLAWIVQTCELQGVLKLFDNHVLAQHFFCRFLNSAYRLQLVEMDRIQANYPAIDLGDKKSGIAYQVTAERRGEKSNHTLDKFTEHGLERTYSLLRVLIMGERQETYKRVNVPSGLHYNCERGVIGITELLKHIHMLDTPRLDELAAVFTEELKPVPMPKGVPSDKATLAVVPERRAICENSAKEFLANLAKGTPSYKLHEKADELYVGLWTRELGWKVRGI